MDNLNDIENKLKQGANEPVFEFKEAYWNDALATLQLAEKAAKRKRLLIILFALLGATILVGGLLYYINTQGKIGGNSTEEMPSQITDHLVTDANKTEQFVDQLSNKEKSSLHSDKSTTTNDESGFNHGINSSKSSGSDELNKDASSSLSLTNTRDKISKKNSVSTQTNKHSGVKNVSGSQSKNTALGSVGNNINNNSKSLLDEKSTQELLVENKASLQQLNIQLIDPSNNRGISNELPNQTIPIISLEKKWSLIANVGTNISPSFGDGNVKADLPNLGLELYYQLSNKFNVSLGGGWYNKSNLDLTIPNVNDLSYSFGSQSRYEVIRLKQLSFVEVPLKLSYQWRRNHLVLLGASYSHVISGKSSRSYSSSGNDANGIFESSEGNEVEYGYYPNLFSKGTYDVFLGYEWRIGRFGLEGRYYQGLNDLTQTFTHQEREFLIDKHLNTRFVLYLKYLIIK